MPKHVVVPYVENTLHSTNKYSCVRPVHTLYIRPVHTLYISYVIEHNMDDKPHEVIKHCSTGGNIYGLIILLYNVE